MFIVLSASAPTQRTPANLSPLEFTCLFVCSLVYSANIYVPTVCQHHLRSCTRHSLLKELSRGEAEGTGSESASNWYCALLKTQGEMTVGTSV